MGGFVVGIDTGGTFTDGFLTDGARVERVKVDTTPHDLTVCFLDCLGAGARAFGFESVAAFLRETRLIFYSTTVGVNALIQRTGAKVGLMVTRGFQEQPYGEPALVGPLVEPPMVVALDEEVGAGGALLREVDGDAALREFKRLLDLGAEIVVVSFNRSHLNPANERKVRDVVRTYYPKHYLGSTPLILASEFAHRPDERTRTNLAVLNAYIHREMVRDLYKAEDHLRRNRYLKPLLVVHGNGGVARVSKSRAVDALGSTPAADAFGTLYWARRYGLPNVVYMDIGGTSTDVGLVLDATLPYRLRTSVYGLQVNAPAVETRSFGGGGGSIASVQDHRVQVGPRSAGARPGPACYGLGGEEATVTDADVVLGRINPEYFLGGRRLLSAARAAQAVQKAVADPLQVGPEVAAIQVVERLADQLARDVGSMIQRAGRRPEEFVLFAIGGAGPTHGPAIAERLGISTIYVFQFSPVFSAFGSSTLDLMHTYEAALSVPLRSQDGGAGEGCAAALGRLREVALRDMRAEGVRPGDVNFLVEAELSIEGEEEPVLVTGLAWDGDPGAASDLLARCRRELRRAGPGGPGSGQRAPEGNGTVSVLRLKAVSRLPHYDFPRAGPARSPLPPPTARRRIFGAQRGWEETPAFRLEALECGARLSGAAVVEAKDATWVVPDGWALEIDGFMNGVIRREGP